MDTVRKVNPNSPTPPPIPSQGRRGAEINPIAVGGAAVVAGLAGIAGTAMAMADDEPVEVEELSAFEDAKSVIDEVEIVPPEHHEHYYAPHVEVAHVDDIDDVDGGHSGAIDDAVAEIDPHAAAEEITGEYEAIDADDISETAMIEFGETDTVYTENGDMTVTMTEVEGQQMAMVDENNDGDYDGFLDSEGNAYAMPTAISQADVEVAHNENMDQYIAHNDDVDIDMHNDDTYDDDVSYT